MLDIVTRFHNLKLGWFRLDVWGKIQFFEEGGTGSTLQAVIHSSLSTTKGSGSDSSAYRGSSGLLCFCARLYLKVHPQFSGISCAIFCCHATMTLIATTYGV